MKDSHWCVHTESSTKENSSLGILVPCKPFTHFPPSQGSDPTQGRIIHTIFTSELYNTSGQLAQSSHTHSIQLSLPTQYASHS